MKEKLLTYYDVYTVIGCVDTLPPVSQPYFNYCNVTASYEADVTFGVEGAVRKLSSVSSGDSSI